MPYFLLKHPYFCIVSLKHVWGTREEDQPQYFPETSPVKWMVYFSCQLDWIINYLSSGTHNSACHKGISRNNYWSQMWGTSVHTGPNKAFWIKVPNTQTQSQTRLTNPTVSWVGYGATEIRSPAAARGLKPASALCRVMGWLKAWLTCSEKAAGTE